MSSDSDAQFDDFFNDFVLSDSEDDSDFEGFDPVDLEGIRFPMVFPNAECARELDVDTEIGWSNDDGNGPVIAPFTANPGIKVDFPENPKPLDFFYSFLSVGMLFDMLCETNLHARECIEGAVLKPFSRLAKWSPLTIDELKVFLAVLLGMGLVGKENISDYWINDDIIETPFFGRTMSRDRFLSIWGNFHLNHLNPDDPPDPLWKLRPFLIDVRQSFLQVYEPDQDISVDEGTCPWKGRLHFKVYNPAKPNKFGIKLYQVCEAKSGYTCGFDIYCGKTESTNFSDAVDIDPDCSTNTKVVVGLLAYTGLLGTGRHIYMDNYYSSPELFNELDHLETYACGTVRKNRKEMPTASVNAKLNVGEATFRRRDNLLAVKFKDKRDVNLISTIHSASKTMVRKRNGQLISKPVCVVDYVMKMRGVDRSDQLAQYYSLVRKTVKWWKKLFLHLLNLMVVNSYIIYTKHFALNHDPLQKQYTHHDFRLQLVQDLLADAPDAPIPARRGRKSNDSLPTRLVERHFPSRTIGKAGAKRSNPYRVCKACNKPKGGREGFRGTQTTFMCHECGDIPLCVPDCFKAFHTKSDYRRALRSQNAAHHSSSSESD